MSFAVKDVAGRRILYVMAVDAEYGPHLKERIKPLMTGVGPVEAAVMLTRTLAELAAERALPDLVVSLGSAGAAKLEQTEVYQAVSVGYRDMDYNGYPTGLKGQRELATKRKVDMVDLVFPPDDVMARLTGGVLNSAQSTLVDILNEVKAVAGS